MYYAVRVYIVVYREVVAMTTVAVYVSNQMKKKERERAWMHIIYDICMLGVRRRNGPKRAICLCIATAMAC